MLQVSNINFIREYLPPYLSVESNSQLLGILRDNFPHSYDPNILYKELDISTYYQGDAIADIPFTKFDIDTHKFDKYYSRGIILSNTCDIDPNNPRDFIPNVIFGVVTILEEFLEHLENEKFDLKVIEKFENSLKNNSLNSYFYLPELRNGDQVILKESFISFDTVTSLPISFLDNQVYNRQYQRLEGDRIFSFSNYGFYLFLFKLSVHFSRIREGVDRDTNNNLGT